MIIDYKPELTLGDVIAVSTAIISSIVTVWATIYFVIKQLKDAREVNASNVGLSIFVELRNLWQQFRDSDDRDKKFKLIQILDYMEYCCFLHWKGIIDKDNSYVAFKAIEDQLNLIFKNELASQIFEEARSEESTYLNIRKFKCRYVDDRIGPEL